MGTCQECVHFDEGMCKLKPGACLNYDHFQWSPMIMISPSDLENKYVSKISYDSLLKRAEAAEAKVAELEADAKRFMQIIDELGRKVAELEAAAKRFKQIIDEIGSKVAELREAVRWIPVTERLPELGVLVLVAQRDKYGSTFGQLWHDDVWLVYDKIFSDQKYWVYPETYHSVTHWMPLPKPPQEDAK